MDADLIEIVSLPPESWPVYRAIRLEALRDSPQAFGTSYADMLVKPDSFWQSRLEDTAKGRSWLLFARKALGAQVVGMIGAFAVPDESSAAHVISVFVTPSARGQGIAGQMLRTILDRLAQAGFAKARLSVNVEQAAALHLYQRLGFVVTVQENNPMGDGLVHEEYIMECLLTSTAS